MTTLRVIKQQRPRHDAAARFTWYMDRVRRVEPAPLGKSRSHDRSDDCYLDAALVGRAAAIVTYDHDLLDPEKPFGIAVVRPLARGGVGVWSPQEPSEEAVLRLRYGVVGRVAEPLSAPPNGGSAKQLNPKGLDGSINSDS